MLHDGLKACFKVISRKMCNCIEVNLFDNICYSIPHMHACVHTHARTHARARSHTRTHMPAMPADKGCLMCIADTVASVLCCRNMRGSWTCSTLCWCGDRQIYWWAHDKTSIFSTLMTFALLEVTLTHAPIRSSLPHLSLIIRELVSSVMWPKGNIMAPVVVT